MSINTPSDSWEEAEKVRVLPRLLMAGTRCLRKEENAKFYIPQEPEEDDAEWQIRVDRTVIFPFFKRAVHRGVNSVLAKPIVLGDDVPEIIRGTDDVARDGQWENVDLEGHDGNTFYAHVLCDAIGESGISHVLVEHPPRPEGATDAEVEGLRPYLVHIPDRQVIYARAETVGGRKRLAEVRIREHGKDDDGEPVEQVRQLLAAGVEGDEEGGDADLSLVRWRVWRDTSTDPKKENWEVVERGTMSPHVNIPLSTLRINAVAWMRGETPFEDLAHLNLLHTQKYSDTSENIRVTSGAQLHRAGMTEKEATEQRSIGAKRLLYSENEGATAEWLERSGSGAVVASDDLKRLEDRMDAISNEPHIRRTGDETATGRAIDAAEARTEVQAWSIALRDHIEETLSFWAIYLGAESGGSVEVPLPPRWSEHGVEGLKLLVEMNTTLGAPRVETILNEVKRLGYLADDVEVAEELPTTAGNRSASSEGQSGASENERTPGT